MFWIYNKTTTSASIADADFVGPFKRRLHYVVHTFTTSNRSLHADAGAFHLMDKLFGLRRFTGWQGVPRIPRFSNAPLSKSRTASMYAECLRPTGSK